MSVEFLIEWFPYTDDRHIISADNTSGCMQYSAEGRNLTLCLIHYTGPTEIPLFFIAIAERFCVTINE